MDSLEAITRDVVACTKCPRLVAWRQQAVRERPRRFAGWDYWERPVPGFGDPAARVLVVGLAPAAHGGNRTGRIFTGDRSGDWLFRAMHRAGFANQPTSVDRDDGLRLTGAYIAAIVRCAPPDNKPLPEERDNCLPYLQRELAALPDVRVIVALGAFALDGIARALGLRPKPRFAHAAEFTLSGGRAMICTFHPSQQNTFTGRLTEEMLDAVFHRASQLIAEY
ncbi:MAG TPA: uracil-DNA glycosylase [Dehalococcoidia bacterium]|nr:uracil-DNA glycosylase [Dehalococcoidia bacterium]